MIKANCLAHIADASEWTLFVELLKILCNIYGKVDKREFAEASKSVFDHILFKGVRRTFYLQLCELYFIIITMV